MRRHLALALLAAWLCAPAPAAPPGAVRSTANYRLPDVGLVRADGQRVALAGELDYAGPLALNFVFTTCSAICPIQSQTFAELRARAGPAMGLRLVSISLDPLNDTPAVLRDYAKKFGAGKDWRFYTGTPDASIAVQRAFDAYRGNKMNHEPLVLLRRGAGQPWIRLEGYAGADQLLRELRPTPAAREIR